MSTTLNKINDANFALNAYTETVKNIIINLKDQYLAPTVTRNITDFSTISGVTFSGGTALGNPSSGIDKEMCSNKCFANSSCVGASYQNGSCQLYSVLPETAARYDYNANHSVILYNRSSTANAATNKQITDNITTTLETKLDALLGKKNVVGELKTSFDSEPYPSDDWKKAMRELNDATQTLADAEDNKKMNKDVQSQLYNSGLQVIQSKTKYILFIVVFLLLLAFYVRDFNFSIFISIILFLIISVYGSIFLGAFLIVVIVLYLVYYAY